MIDVLTSAAEPVERQSAAEALCAFHDPAAVPALLKALDDPYGLVRHHAARALLAIHGALHEIEDPHQGCSSDDLERRLGGKRAIHAAIAGQPIAQAR